MFKPEIGCLTDGILCISDAESASAWTFIGNVKIYLVFISVYDKMKLIIQVFRDLQISVVILYFPHFKLSYFIFRIISQYWS